MEQLSLLVDEPDLQVEESDSDVNRVAAAQCIAPRVQFNSRALPCSYLADWIATPSKISLRGRSHLRAALLAGFLCRIALIGGEQADVFPESDSLSRIKLSKKRRWIAAPVRDLVACHSKESKLMPDLVGRIQAQMPPQELIDLMLEAAPPVVSKPRKDGSRLVIANHWPVFVQGIGHPAASVRCIENEHTPSAPTNLLTLARSMPPILEVVRQLTEAIEFRAAPSAKSAAWIGACSLAWASRVRQREGVLQV